MRSILTVTTAPSVTSLTTLQRVKDELGIADGASDAILNTKIAEASSDIEAHLGRTLSRATLTQTFWGEGCAECLLLGRVPVASITSVTVDDVLVDADEYRLDSETGALYRLDSSGYPDGWDWCKSVVVVFAAGYLLPGETGRNLPPAIEAGAVSLVQSFWSNRGRDPLVKSMEIPGVISEQYWIGAVGEAGSLPPDVWSKIAAYRATRQA